MTSTSKKGSLSRDLAPVAAAAIDTAVPLLGTALSAASGLMGKVLRASVDKRLERWFADVAAAGEFGSYERLVEEIDEHCDEPWAHDGVVHGLRAMLDAVDEAAFRSLAALSADYFHSRKAPDAFYRRAARIFAECGAAELLALREAAGNFQPLAVEEGMIVATGGEYGEGWEPVNFTFQPDACASEHHRCHWEVEGSQAMQDVLNLLCAHRFGESTVTHDPYEAAYATGPVEPLAATRFNMAQRADVVRLLRYVIVSERVVE